MLNTKNLQKDLTAIGGFIASIWLVYFLDLALPIQEWLGLVPRDLQGLAGIVTMPFLHVDLGHLIANTVPLVVLLLLLAASRANTWMTVVAIALLGAAILWVFGRNGSGGLVQIHIGASVLIFGLTTYLIARAVFERNATTILVAIIVGVLYGGSTLSGVLPTGDGLSWDGHLSGAVAGVIVAFLQNR